MYCDEEILPTDRARADASGNEFHHECFLRMVIGSVGHQQNECDCHGLEDHSEEGISRREAAQRALAYWTEEHLATPAPGELSGFVQNGIGEITRALLKRCDCLGHRDVAVVVVNTLSESGPRFTQLVDDAPELPDSPILVGFNLRSVLCTDLTDISLTAAGEIAEPAPLFHHWLVTLNEPSITIHLLSLADAGLPADEFVEYLELPAYPEPET